MKNKHDAVLSGPDPHASPGTSRLTKTQIIGLILAVPFVILVAVAYLSPDDWQLRKPHTTGRVYTSTGAGGTLLHYVTEEERSRRVWSGATIRRMQTWRTLHYSRYHLHTLSVETGKSVKIARVAEIENAVTGGGPQILGTTTGTVWMYNNGLEARDPVSLEVKLTSDDVRKRNTDLAAIVPNDIKFFKVSEPHGTLIFKGLDAEIYRLDSSGGIISKAEEAPLEALSYSKSANEGFNYISVAGQAIFHTSPASFLINSFITSTGDWYALLTRDERKGLTLWPGKGGRAWGEVARSLYKTKYQFDGTKEIVIDPGKVEEVAGHRLLQAGFLIRREGAVWDVPSPSSTLVLCKQALGEDQPWHVARLARDGTIVWKQSTTLSDFDQIADGGSKVIFYGRSTVDRRELYANEHIVFIDAESGNVTAIRPAEDKIEEPE